MTVILIVDDHPTFRDGLRAAFEATSDLVVGGEAVTSDDALAQAASLRPDVVVMDLGLPGVGGVEVTRRLCAARSDAVVLVVSMYDDVATITEVLRAGARGYVTKSDAPADIVRAVRSVASGDMVIGPAVAARFRTSATSGPPAQAFPALTEREHEVLDLVASGANNPDIARRLRISEKTVRNHLSSLLTKLQVTTRAEAIVAARDAGLGVRQRDRRGP